MRIFKKICRGVKIFFIGFLFGVKKVDKLTTTNQSDDDTVFEVTDDGGGGVFNDILEQKVTQEVQELRYSSYVVANESKKYKYIGNGNAVKKTESQLSEKHGLIDTSDNLQIVLIQDNLLVCEDVLTILNEVNENDNKKIFDEYILKIKRDIFPRFLIEKYIKKIVVKKSDENYVLDLYISKYPGQFSEKKDKAFLSEIRKIKNKEIKNSDILDFNEIKFITSNAWGFDDWYSFSFTDFEFYDVIDFDGNNIIRLGCSSNVFGENLLDKIYCKSAEEKYKEKKIKQNAIVYFDTYSNNEYPIQNGIDLNNLKNVKFNIDNNQ